MHQLLREGVSKAEVGHRLGLSRQTIYNWVKQEIEKAKEAVRACKLDPETVPDTPFRLCEIRDQETRRRRHQRESCVEGKSYRAYKRLSQVEQGLRPGIPWERVRRAGLLASLADGEAWVRSLCLEGDLAQKLSSIPTRPMCLPTRNRL